MNMNTERIFLSRDIERIIGFPCILRRVAFCSQQNCRFVPTASFTNGPVFRYRFTYVGLSGTHRGRFLVETRSETLEIPFEVVNFACIYRERR